MQVLGNDVLLLFGQAAHSDLKYALTVNEHLYHHLNNLPIHAGKLPFLSILYPLQIMLGDLIAVKVFTILMLFLSAALVYFANKQFIRRFKGARGYWLSASCFVGSLVIMYNPWTMNKIHHHFWLVLSLAASYLLIAALDSYIYSKEKKSVRRFIMIAVSASLVASQPQGGIIYFLPMLAVYLTVNLIFHRPEIISKHAVKKIGILVIITIACNLFWLVPVIQSITANRISQDIGSLNYETSQGVVTYGIVHENVDELSRRATIHNVLQGTGAWLWGGDSSQDSSIKINNTDLWEGLALLPLSFIFLYFFIKRPIGKDITYVVMFFSALVVLSVVLATGSYYNDTYKMFFLEFPLGESIRDPYKFSGLYFVPVSFFASASLYRLEKKSLGKNIAIFLSMIGLIFAWGWVGLTGNLNGHLTESLPPYPHDLSDVSEYLHREYTNGINARGKIFWYPSGGERTQLQYFSVPELSTASLPNLELPRFQLDYINYLIKKNDTSFIHLLEYLGVKYLVIREDFVDNVSPASIREALMRVQNLKTILQENKVFESGRFGVYKLNTNSLVSVSHAISLGTDDLSKIARIAGESEYLNNIELAPFLEDSLIVSDLLPPELSGEAITIVDPTGDHHLPRNYWSVGAINGGWLNTITPYLKNFGISTWEFDYNKGFIFTWGEDSIDIPFKVGNNNGNNNEDYKLFIRYLESPQGGRINTTLEDKLSQISTLSSNSKFVWRDLGNYTLNQGSHSVKFTNEKGFNAINAMLLIQKDQFEAIKGQIQDWLNRNSTSAIYIFEGESDMNGNNRTIVGGESFSGNEMIVMNSTTWKQFDVKKEGDYRIWIKGSGSFNVKIDDHKEIVNASMNRPLFSDTFRLKEGDTRLELSPSPDQKKLRINYYQGSFLAENTSRANNHTNAIDSIWLVSDNNRLHELLDEDRNDSSNQMQVTTSIPSNVWSSQKYEIRLNNITRPLIISLAEPFNPDLKAAIYTKDGLSKVEDLIPLFYSLKSGFYVESTSAETKVVVYDASARLEWFAVSSFISLVSYALLILSIKINLSDILKDLSCSLNYLIKR